MNDLLDEMRQCKSVQACIDLALTDAYGDGEQAVAWLTCIEEMFAHFKQVKLLDETVTLAGFDLNGEPPRVFRSLRGLSHAAIGS